MSTEYNYAPNPDSKGYGYSSSPASFPNFALLGAAYGPKEVTSKFRENLQGF